MTTTLLPVPRPSRLRPWVRVLLWACALVVALVAACVLYVAAALSGGIDDLLDVTQSAPGDRQVVASRERALERLTGEAGALATGPVLARGTGSTCEVGEHTWKRDDAFDLACSAAAVVVLPRQDLRADALALHERLLADGWQPGSLALDGVVRDYWDSRATVPVRNWPDGYGPAELPAASYVRGDLALEVAWLADGRGDVRPLAADEVVWTPAPPRTQGLAVVLAVQAEHFRG